MLLTRACVAASLLLLGACSIPDANYYEPEADENVTVGTVQREIRIGMSSAEVVEVMGSPNIVSTDADRTEVWVYDKIATQSARADARAGVLLLGFGPHGGGLASGSGRNTTSATSQRTLTVIIKFDADDRVRDFAYHTSRF